MWRLPAATLAVVLCSAAALERASVERQMPMPYMAGMGNMDTAALVNYLKGRMAQKEQEIAKLTNETQVLRSQVDKNMVNLAGEIQDLQTRAGGSTKELEQCTAERKEQQQEVALYKSQILGLKRENHHLKRMTMEES
mmetsp:Transcript_120409/g.341139  ORF Transcript_120409/g.341139 Transcript_120409/m.341139 type:complete len:138 (+) Transcript_120409:87-500(+)